MSCSFCQGRPTDIGLPAVLAEGKGKGGMLFLLFTFFNFPLSSLSLSFVSSTISSVSFLPFSGRQHKLTHKD